MIGFGFVEVVGDDEVVVEDGGCFGYGFYCVVVGVVGQGVDVDLLFCDLVVVVEDFEGEVIFFVEEIIDVVGFDFEGVILEVLVLLGDGLFGD